VLLHIIKGGEPATAKPAPAKPAAKQAQPGLQAPAPAIREGEPPVPRTVVTRVRSRDTAARLPATEKPEAPARPAPKPKAALPAENRARIWVGVGAEDGISAHEIIGALTARTGLPETVVSGVDIRARHLFLEVDAAHAEEITTKFKRTEVKGRRVKVKPA
jgi:hypothetical protein